MAVPTLLVTGPVGVGKTSIGGELLDVLEECGLPCAFFDLDALTTFHPRPPDDPWGESFALDSLRDMVRRLRATRLILAYVLEDRGQLDRYRDVVPDAEITVVRLTAPVRVIHERLRRRELSSGLEWYLDRAVELDAHWRANPVEDFTVATESRSLREIADEILRRAGWA